MENINIMEVFVMHDDKVKMIYGKDAVMDKRGVIVIRRKGRLNTDIVCKNGVVIKNINDAIKIIAPPEGIDIL